MSSHRILLVEDDPGIVEAMTIFLEEEGYAVLCAPGAAEALAMLEEAGPGPAVILLDLMMPGMDAFEFRARQRADPRLAAIPVVVVSADRHAPERARELGAAGCLLKPMRPDDLLATVRRYCDPVSAERPARAGGAA